MLASVSSHADQLNSVPILLVVRQVSVRDTTRPPSYDDPE